MLAIVRQCGPILPRWAPPSFAAASARSNVRQLVSTTLPRYGVLGVSLARAALRPTRCARRASTAAEGAADAAAAGNRRLVGYWLAGTAGMVFAMVVLGGVTRLTRSGLSIVEWRPEGERYPRNEWEWAEEFAKYKAFPEYQRVNSRMSLEEFKPIYFMEWAHRMWGRAIGIAFAGPLLYLVVARRLPPGFGPRLSLLLGIGAMQGGVGWWMVKSGLEAERFGPLSIPRVSPYRLATHLGFAFTLYSALAWSAWDCLRPSGAGATAAQVATALRLRPVVLLSTGLIAVTVASGAFVAGNDAGHAFNDWPLFAGRLVPEGIWEEALGWGNLFENTATVQFDHRALAYASVAGVGAVHMAAKRAGGLRSAAMPPGFRAGALALGILVAGQATLGITTLLLYVPPALGAAHQAGSLALLTAALYSLHTIQKVAGGGRHVIPAMAIAMIALPAGRERD